MSPSFSPPLSPRDLVRVVFRHKRKGIAFFVGAMALTVLGLAICPRIYTSEARLFVRLGRENAALDPTVTTGQVMTLHNSREWEINSVIEVLRSRSNLEQVLDRVGMEKPDPSPLARDKALRDLAKDLEVYTPRNSTVVIVTAEAKSPERAQQIVAALIDVYAKEHLRINRASGSYEFFDEQAKLLKERLDAAEAELRDAKKMFGIVSLPERRTALQQQISRVEQQIQENESALAASEAKIIALGDRLERLPDNLVRQLVSGQPNDGAAAMRDKLFQLQTRERELLSKFQEIHPEVIAVREQVREAEAILEQDLAQHAEAAAAVLAAEESLAASLEARAESLADQHRRLKAELVAFNEQELQVVQMERKVGVLDASYTAYVKNLEQTRIDQALKNEGISNIAVAQPATLMLKPASPKKGLTLAIALVLASAGAFAVIFLAEFFDESLKSPAEIESRLDLPVLATLPEVSRGLLAST
jgi:uncharacterized protein involved in exopolysaccharide biosynthesis